MNKLNEFSAQIIKCIKYIENEESQYYKNYIKTIHTALRGKSPNIDFFKNSNFFGAYPNLTMKNLIPVLNELVSKGYIIEKIVTSNNKNRVLYMTGELNFIIIKELNLVNDDILNIDVKINTKKSHEDLKVDNSNINIKLNSIESVNKRVLFLINYIKNNPNKTLNLKNVDLRGANLRGIDLHGADLRFANLQGANFSSILGKYVKVIKTKGIKSSFNSRGYRKITRTNLKDANLSNADLRKTNLSNADLTNSRINKAKFKGANFKGSILSGVELSQTSFKETNIIEASIKEIPIEMFDEIGVNGILRSIGNVAIVTDKIKEYKKLYPSKPMDLRGLDLRGGDLSGLNLYGSSLQNSDLSSKIKQKWSQGSKYQTWHGVTFNKKGGIEVIINETRLEGSDLSFVNFQNANLEGANLKNTNLSDVNLQNANLELANLKKSNLTNADLKGANIKNASFSEADVFNANFTGVDCKFASFKKVDTTKAIGIKREFLDKLFDFLI